MKVKFKEDGEILERLYKEDLNEIFLNEINDTISCIIPKFLNKRNLDEFNGEYTYDFGDDKDKNISWMSNAMNGSLSFDDDILEDSKYDSNVNFTIQNNNFKESVLKKNFLIKNDDNEENNELNNNITINGLIKSIEISSNQVLNFIKDEGKELAEKYKNKLSNLDLKSDLNFSSSNKLRVLSKQDYENLKLQKGNKNYLRDLTIQGDITPSLEFPLVFENELFKIKIFGIPFVYKIKIDWVPQRGNIFYQHDYIRGNKKYNIKEEIIEIENYSNITISYKVFINTILNYLNHKLLDKFGEQFIQLSNLIENNLTSFSLNLESVFKPFIFII